jgi:hypothetical protein
LNELKDLNSEKIFYLEEEMRLVKTELTFIKNIQKEYYTKLLKQGDDIRGKGLIWIIQTMWDIDFKVTKQMFPDMMDELSKDFLLDLATKDYELMKMKKEYQFFKISLKNLLELANKSRSTSRESKRKLFSTLTSSL